MAEKEKDEKMEAAKEGKKEAHHPDYKKGMKKAGKRGHGRHSSKK